MDAIAEQLLRTMVREMAERLDPTRADVMAWRETTIEAVARLIAEGDR